MARIFVSYSRTDRAVVDKLVPLLERMGDDVWFDDALPGGERWWTKIQNEIKTRDIFLYLVSTESLESEYCQREWRLAHAQKKHILPVLIEAGADRRLPPELSQIQFVDVSSGIVTPVAEGITRLHAAIDQIEREARRRRATLTTGIIVAFLVVVSSLVLGVDFVQARAGGQIAFVSDRSGNKEIYVMDVQPSLLSRILGGHIRNLTNNSSSDVSPAWSPDGQLIAFVSNRDGDDEIFVMDAEGNNVRQLTFNSVADTHPTWSPDGRQIAFVSNRDGDEEIWVMDADGGNPRQLTDNDAIDTYPSWSPDGTQIIFQSNRLRPPSGLGATTVEANFDLYVIDLNADSTPRLLVSNVADDEQPAWNPDGGRLAFVSRRETSTSLSSRPSAPGNSARLETSLEIYVIDRSGGDLRRLTFNSAADTMPAWSPDGRYIAFVSNRDSGVQPNLDIYVIDVVGNQVRRLTDADPAEDSQPVWRPG